MPDYIVGLDLGQTSDPSALSVLKRSMVLKDGRPVRSNKGGILSKFAVVHLERFPLMTAYPDIVEQVGAVLNRPQLKPWNPRLAVDATGVGRAVMDMFIGAKNDDGTPLFQHENLFAITITAGTDWSAHRYSPSVFGFHVPKVELASVVQAGIGSRRLEFGNLRDKHILDIAKKELKSFKIKVTKAGNDTFQAREGDHDDIVLSIACGMWLGSLPRIAHRTTERYAEIEASTLAAKKPIDEVLREMRLTETPELRGMIEDHAAEIAAMRAQEQWEEQARAADWRNPSNPAWWDRFQ